MTDTTMHINPDILDATGALRCAEGTHASVIAARRQMERLGANALRQLGDVPAVREIFAYQADIAACETTINHLIEEHIRHTITQAELARDPNLANAAIGYLDARLRA